MERTSLPPGSAAVPGRIRRSADEGVRAPRKTSGVLLFLLLAVACAAQSDSPYGRRIVEVRSRPASLPPAQLSLQPGQTLTSAGLSAAMNEIKTHLGRRAEAAAALAGGGILSFTYVTADFDLQPPGHPGGDAVAVTLRPFHLSLPLEDTGARVLPVPRDLAFSLAPGRTPPVFLPATLNLGRDRVLGPTLGGRWQLQAGPQMAGDSRARLIRVRLDGLTSLESALYSANGDVRAAREWGSGLLRQVAGGLEGAAALSPRGSGRYDQRTWGGTAGVALALNANTRLRFDARYAGTRHRYSDTPAATDWRNTREQANRVLFETIPPRALGFFRAAVWQENLDPRPGPAARRLAGRAGYAKEIPVGTNRSIGVELVAGAGQTWGAVEAPRRFFAGGSQGQFLYESASGATLAAMPEGPLLRSLGKAQGGFGSGAGAVAGGTRYRHLNLNLSLPIPRWSRPLIPDILTDLPGVDGSPQTLKQVLRTQIDRSGPNLLQANLQVLDKLTPEEARRRAEQIFGEIRPATQFVIEQANVFAVKPLLMFDVAELEAGPERASWTAAGAGVQLVVVTARFELGYMRTLSGPRFGARGNVFARLGFERLF